MYQQCSRLKKEGKKLSGTLFEKLDEIGDLLKPVEQIGEKRGNRMIYCMAVDYLALVYHKKATKKLGDVIGEKEFYVDNNDHFILLQQKLGESQGNQQLVDSIKEAINLFFKAASLFEKVVSCQELLQRDECNVGSPKYIWKSYALYNQARCEFAIHLILKIYSNITSKDFEGVDPEIINRSNSWHEDLCEAVISRREDYIDFEDQKEVPLFPQFITFNMKAEYFHAFYEYELSCLIEKQINPEFKAEDLPNYEEFKTWKESNLTITDVLSVDGKVERIEKLKADYVRKEIKKLINEVVPDETKRETVYKQLQDFSPEIVKAILSVNVGDIQNAETTFWNKVKVALADYHIEPSVEVGGLISLLFVKLKLVLKKGK